MGGAGSGRRKPGVKTEDEKEPIREALQLAERAAPRIMQKVIDQADTGVKWAQEIVLDRGLGKPTAKLDVSGTVTHLVLSAEQYALLTHAAEAEMLNLEEGFTRVEPGVSHS